MKLNWGYSILIVIFVFVIGIGFLVYISFQHKVNLVHKDYYPLEIEHQKMINKEDNLRELNLRIDIKVEDNYIKVDFPDFFNEAEVVGEILLFRPSDFEEDKTIQIKLDSTGCQYISTNNLLNGKYLVKVDWSHSGVAYFQQDNVFIK